MPVQTEGYKSQLCCLVLNGRLTFRRFKNFVLVILLLFLYLPPGLAIELDEARLFIKSDALTLNNQEKSGVFTGNVIVNFQDMILRTSKLIVYYEERDNKKAISRILIPTMLKAVKLDTGEKIIADSADYSVSWKQLTFSGNVKMLKENKLLVTEKLVYFTKIKDLK